MLNRDLWRRPYGAANPLRSLTLHLGYERSVSHEDERYRGVVSLLDQTSAFTVGGTAHLLFAGRCGLDVTGFIGQDSTRDLKFVDADLYGFGARLTADLSARLACFVDGAYSSENTVESQSGVYRSLTAGLHYYF
mgnify:FL=1